jgi:hypothetical protein
MHLRGVWTNVDYSDTATYTITIPVCVKKNVGGVVRIYCAKTKNAAQNTNWNSVNYYHVFSCLLSFR